MQRPSHNYISIGKRLDVETKAKKELMALERKPFDRYCILIDEIVGSDNCLISMV